MATHEESARFEPEPEPGRRAGQAPMYRMEPGEEREAEVSRARGWRMSWGAVFAGFIVAMVVQTLLTLLGLAIGLGAIDLTTGGVGGLGTGAAIWAGLTALISLFVGGLVAGHLAGRLTRTDGMLHGVLVWGLSMLLTTLALSTGLSTLLGGVFGAAGQTISTVVGTAGQVGAAAVQPGQPVPTSEQEVVDLLERRGMTEQQAQQTVTEMQQTGVQLQQQVQQVQQQAPQVATQVAGTLSTALWVTLLVALLSLAAAVGGAAITAKS